MKGRLEATVGTKRIKTGGREMVLSPHKTANVLWKVTPDVQGKRDVRVVQQLTLRNEDGGVVHSMYPSDICRDLPSYEWLVHLSPCE